MSRPTIVSSPAPHLQRPWSLAILGVLATALILAAATFGASSLASSAAPDLATRGLRDNSVDPLDHQDTDIAVLIFTQTECPISNSYAPEIARLQQRFAPEGVRFWLVYPDPDDDIVRVRSHTEQYRYGCAVALDHEHRLVARTGVSVTPEVAVFVGQDLAYRGRISDRETDFGKRRHTAGVHDLEDALQQIVRGEEPLSSRTKAVGCYIQDLQ